MIPVAARLALFDQSKLGEVLRLQQWLRVQENVFSERRNGTRHSPDVLIDHICSAQCVPQDF